MILKMVLFATDFPYKEESKLNISSLHRVHKIIILPERRLPMLSMVTRINRKLEEERKDNLGISNH